MGADQIYFVYAAHSYANIFFVFPYSAAQILLPRTLVIGILLSRTVVVGVVVYYYLFEMKYGEPVVGV
jgi:hypothetical protein